MNCFSTLFTTWEFKARDHTNGEALVAGGSHCTDIRWYQGRKDVYFVWRALFFLMCYVWWSYLTLEKKI